MHPIRRRLLLFPHSLYPGCSAIKSLAEIIPPHNLLLLPSLPFPAPLPRQPVSAFNSPLPSEEGERRQKRQRDSLRAPRIVSSSSPPQHHRATRICCRLKLLQMRYRDNERDMAPLHLHRRRGASCNQKTIKFLRRVVPLMSVEDETG